MVLRATPARRATALTLIADPCLRMSRSALLILRRVVVARLMCVGAQTIDGFLRSRIGVADRLADYLHATGRDHPQPPDRAGYDAGLVIDLVSFTARALRAHRQGPVR
jgi:hypothetical protein